jgi:hypothetical protein
VRLVRRWPFITLAVLTLIVGAVWHATTGGARSGIVFTVVSLLGAPFIAAMRWARQLIGWSPPYTQLLGFLLGLAPYVLAEFALRFVRARRGA